jgi:predicted nucleic acid-binding protein
MEATDRDALFLASRIWRTYRKQGGKRMRILPDFIVGAHAQAQANGLISRDRGFYRSRFPTSGFAIHPLILSVSENRDTYPVTGMSI